MMPPVTDDVRLIGLLILASVCLGVIIGILIQWALSR